MSLKFRYFFIALVLVSPFFVMCSGMLGSDEEIILEMYAQILQAYNREDLYGQMKYISKEYSSSIENQRNYDEMKEYRERFILSNRNVSVDFRDITVLTSEHEATVSYEVRLRTNRRNDTWRQVDTLYRKRGKWEIHTTRLIP